MARVAEAPPPGEPLPLGEAGALAQPLPVKEPVGEVDGLWLSDAVKEALRVSADAEEAGVALPQALACVEGLLLAVPEGEKEGERDCDSEGVNEEV